jgi:mercuric ion transport protein
MRDQTLITTGIIGAVVAAVCCATPFLAVLFGAVGLTAWLANADYVLIPALLLCIALIAFGLYRQRTRPTPPEPPISATRLRKTP